MCVHRVGRVLCEKIEIINIFTIITFALFYYYYYYYYTEYLNVGINARMIVLHVSSELLVPRLRSKRDHTQH